MSQPPQPLDYQTLPKEDLRGIAFNQKVILYCILGEILVIIAVQVFKQPPPAAGAPVAVGMLLSQLLLSLAYLAIAITAAVFVFKLAIKLFGMGAGIAMGICSLIPCVGLIILLVMSQKATTALQKNGIPVGLMGAKKPIRDI